jgi:hypothetical protein
MAPACQNQPTKVPPGACAGAPSKLCLGGMSIRHKTLTRLATRLFSQCLADLKRRTQSWSMHFRNFQFITTDGSRKRRGIRAPQLLEIKVDALEVSASTNLMLSRELSLPLNQNRETRRRPPPTATRSSQTAINQSGKRDIFTRPVRARYPANAPITPPRPPNTAPITEE